MLVLMSFKVPAELLVCLIHGINKILLNFSLWGGFARGNAIGNIFTFGDEPMADLPALRQKGKVMLHISDQDPSTIVPKEQAPSFQKSVEIQHMSKPLFKALGKSWPAIINPGKSHDFDL